MSDFTLNNLFLGFIKEWIDETKAANTHGSSFSSHVGFTYKKAYDNLKKYEIPLVTTSDALKVNGIGKTLLARLGKKLEGHVVLDIERPDLMDPIIPVVKKGRPSKTAESVRISTRDLFKELIINRSIIEKAKADLLNKPTTPVKKKRVLKPKEYIPAFRSGAYAILLSLVKSTRDVFMDKSEIIRGGQPLCDASFDIPDVKGNAKFGHTAWSSMKTLIEKELVYKYGNPARFCLTEDGKLIADKLLKVTDANMLDPTSDYSSESDAAGLRAKLPIGHNTLKRTLISDASIRMISAESLSSFSRGWSVDNPIALHTTNRNTAPLVDASCNHANKIQAELDLEARIRVRKERDESFAIEQLKNKKKKIQHDIEQAEANAEIERMFKVKNASPRRVPIVSILSSSPYKPLVLNSYAPYHSASILTRNQSNESVICISSDDENDISIIDMTKSSPTYVSKSKPLAFIQPSLVPQQLEFKSKPTSIPISVSSLSSVTAVSNPPDNQLPQHLMTELLNVTPICLPKHSYDICLVLDSREVRQQKDRSYFQDNLQRAGITCLTRSLSLGDAIWIARPRDPSCYDEIILDVIVERKTMCDLVSSIRDGRFKEQGFRLAGSCIKDVVYLVEEDNGGHGNVAGEVNGFGIGAIRASYCHSMVANGFFVKLTKDCEDTLSYFEAMTRFLQDKKGVDLYAIPSRCVTKLILPDIKVFLESKFKQRKYFLSFSVFQELNLKTKSNTINDIWTKQLLCVRGISAEKAVSISKHYPTMRRMAYLKCKTEKDKELLLKTSVTGVGRASIQKVLSKKIHTLFNVSEYE